MDALKRVQPRIRLPFVFFEPSCLIFVPAPLSWVWLMISTFSFGKSRRRGPAAEMPLLRRRFVFLSPQRIVAPMKPLTTSCYTFHKLIEGGFLYLDKTANIYELIRPATAQYFLARPRRFGKSLLISTLRSIFEGKRELFQGLDILDTDYDWETFPVIHLDLGTCASKTEAELEENLLSKVLWAAHEENCVLKSTRSCSAFDELVKMLYERDGNVVILIDEYDKPLLNHLGEDFSSEIQALLKRFYSVIKTTEKYQRFVLLTGVSKFSKVSIFSDLNNLTDLTMHKSASTLLGYTEEELHENFSEYIDQLALETEETVDETKNALRKWYNGYRFSGKAASVYNPVSIMKCFGEMELKNYWFETGTPSFLFNLLREAPIDFSDLTAQETAFSAYEAQALKPLPLLVQTGYLTLKSAEQVAGMTYYKLGFPNWEIEQSFNFWLTQDFAGLPPEGMSSGLAKLWNAMRHGEIEETLETLKIFFASIPNTISIQNEKYYQTIFFTLFRLLGATIDVEVSTNIGRIDAVVKTEEDIFIFEFKLHDTAENALKQIHEKQYAQPYLSDDRPVTLIGVAFGEKERNLTDWIIEAG